MGMMMNMGSNATDDNLAQALEEDVIMGGKGNFTGSGKGGMSSVQGNSTGTGKGSGKGGGKGGMSTVQDDSSGGGKGAQRDKRGPEAPLSGMMMMSTDSDATSLSTPKSMRNKFRHGKNSTDSAKIMHALHHSNVSVVELNHTLSDKNENAMNSTIGSLLERFRKGLNQGLHHDKNTSTNNSTQWLKNESDEENDEFSRWTFLWEKLLGGLNSEKVDGNETSTIGTKLWKWFQGKN